MRHSMRLTAAALLVLAAPACSGDEATANSGGNDAADAAEAAPAEQGVADPEAFVRATYDRYAGSRETTPPEGALSPRLKSLVERDRQESAGEIGRLDFDYWVNGQDYELSEIEVASEPGTDERRVVVARFRNFDRPQVSRFEFVRTDGRWYLDEVRNDGTAGDDGSGWVLSRLLEAPL